MRSKVSIIGAGKVGATCALLVAEKGYADVVLVDAIKGLAEGEALDLQEAMSIIGSDIFVTGTNGYEAAADSDIVVITSGKARKHGMSRVDLATANMKVVREVTEHVAQTSPNAIIILVTNPVDAMTYVALKTSGFPRNRVLGQAGILDSARFRTFIATELDVSEKDVFTHVLGEHGNLMVIIPRLCTVSGIPITHFLSEVKIDGMIERTVNGGAEIVNLIKTGSAFYAPGAAAAHMVDAVIRDRRNLMSCVACLDGEYGIRNTAIGAMVIVGKNGVEQVLEHPLTPGETTKLRGAASAVRDLITEMGFE